MSRVRFDASLHRPLAVISSVTAVLALGGAIALATGSMNLGPVAQSRLPFHSSGLAGFALFAIVAVPMVFTARLAWRRDVRTSSVAMVAGGALIGWIVIQILFLRVFSWLQPTMGIVGVAILTIGYLQLERVR